MKLSVTGMGIVSPAGIGKDVFFESLARGTTGIVQYDNNPFNQKAGIVKYFSVKQYTKNFKQARPLSRASHFAIAASTMAAEDAGFSLTETGDYQTGIITGSNNQVDDSVTLPVLNAYERSLDEDGKTDYVQFANRGLRELPAKLLLSNTANISTFACSYELSLNGYSNTITGGNAFFAALVETDIAMRRKMADRIFCGATDSLVNPTSIIKLIPPGASKIEDCTRIPGEGSVFFFLEDSTRVDKKKCKAYAEILSCNGTLFHDFKDIENNITTALHEANLTVDDIDAIIASQGAELICSGPVLESIAKCFKKRSNGLPISSHLPYTGYTGAAAGAFDLALGIFIIETGKVPPLLQPTEISSFEPLCYSANGCIEKLYKTILMINIGLTGSIYCMVIGRQEQ